MLSIMQEIAFPVIHIVDAHVVMCDDVTLHELSPYDSTSAHALSLCTRCSDTVGTVHIVKSNTTALCNNNKGTALCTHTEYNLNWRTNRITNDIICRQCIKTLDSVNANANASASASANASANASASASVNATSFHLLPPKALIAISKVLKKNENLSWEACLNYALHHLFLMLDNDNSKDHLAYFGCYTLQCLEMFYKQEDLLNG